MTTSQEQRLLARVTKLEELLNDVLTANSQYITLTQINQLLTLIQTEQQAVIEQVSALEDRITNIESEPIS